MWLSLRFLPLKEGGHQEQDVSVLSYIDLPNPPNPYLHPPFTSFPLISQKELILLLPLNLHTLFGYFKPFPHSLPLSEESVVTIGPFLTPVLL